MEGLTPTTPVVLIRSQWAEFVFVDPRTGKVRSTKCHTPTALRQAWARWRNAFEEQQRAEEAASRRRDAWDEPGSLPPASGRL